MKLYLVFQISSVFASSIVLLVILWVANLLESLPKVTFHSLDQRKIQCVLSSIIIVALKSMLSQFVELPKLWKYSKFDFVTFYINYLFTMSFLAYMDSCIHGHRDLGRYRRFISSSSFCYNDNFIQTTMVLGLHISIY